MAEILVSSGNYLVPQTLSEPVKLLPVFSMIKETWLQRYKTFLSESNDVYFVFRIIFAICNHETLALEQLFYREILRKCWSGNTQTSHWFHDGSEDINNHFLPSQVSHITSIHSSSLPPLNVCTRHRLTSSLFCSQNLSEINLLGNLIYTTLNSLEPC